MNSPTRFRGGISYGNAWLYATLIKWLRVVDIRVFYVFAAVFVIPFTLILSAGSRITFRYFYQHRSYGWLRAWIATYRSHCLFAQTVVDKFAVYAGRKFQFSYEGLDYYETITAHPGALLQMSAHIGCSEILGYTLSRKKVYNVLVDGTEKESMMKYRRSAFEKTKIRMIPVGNGAESSRSIAAALERGEIVGVFADRFANSNKVVTSRLFGQEIRLSRGMFSLAVTRGLDVVMVNAMKERDGSYRAFFTPLSYDKSLSPKEQRQQLADSYAAEIERLMILYPLQWFNYFELWSETNKEM